jgi:hypothetical protein
MVKINFIPAWVIVRSFLSYQRRDLGNSSTSSPNLDQLFTNTKPSNPMSEVSHPASSTLQNKLNFFKQSCQVFIM